MSSNSSDLGSQDGHVRTKGLKDRESGLNNKVGVVKQAIEEVSDVSEKMGKRSLIIYQDFVELMYLQKNLVSMMKKD